MEKYIQQVIDEEKECLNKFEQEENIRKSCRNFKKWS